MYRTVFVFGRVAAGAEVKPHVFCIIMEAKYVLISMYLYIECVYLLCVYAVDYTNCQTLF